MKEHVGMESPKSNKTRHGLHCSAFTDYISGNFSNQVSWNLLCGVTARMLVEYHCDVACVFFESALYIISVANEFVVEGSILKCEKWKMSLQLVWGEIRVYSLENDGFSYHFY